MEDKNIFIAIESGDVNEVVKMLKEDISLLNSVNFLGNLPIHFAAQTSLEMTKALIDMGADVNSITKEFFTPLFYAKDVEIAKYLVEKGANIEAEDHQCHTPIFYQVDFGHRDVVKYLVEKGANCNKRCCSGFLLNYAMLAYELDGDEYIFNLIYKNTNKNIVSNLHWELINCAIHVNDLKWLKELVAIKNYVLEVNRGGETLLHIAARYSVSKDMFEYLIESGIDVNAKENSGHTALTKLAYYGNYSLEEAEDVVNLFVQSGADLTIRTNFGETAMDIAKNRNKHELYNVLKKFNFIEKEKMSS